MRFDGLLHRAGFLRKSRGDVAEPGPNALGRRCLFTWRRSWIAVLALIVLLSTPPGADAHGVPAPPVDLVAKVVEGKGVALTWDAPSHDGSTPVGGRIVRKGCYWRFGRRYSPVNRMRARSSSSTVMPACFRCLTASPRWTYSSG